MEYISSMAKVEDELNLDRKEKKEKKFFINDESILSNRWINGRSKFKTTEEFIKNKKSFLGFKAIGIIKSLLIILCFIDFLFFLKLNTNHLLY